MPDFELEALERSKLYDAYRERPAYQQNDYIGWITRAKQPATRQKRLDQMLDELKRGGVYMNMRARALEEMSPGPDPLAWNLRHATLL